MKRKSVALGFILLLGLTGCMTRKPAAEGSGLHQTGEGTLPLTPWAPPDLPGHCPHYPLGGFYDVWRNEQVFPQIGCALQPAVVVRGTEAYLDCMHALWLQEQQLFVALAYTSAGYDWQFVDDASGIPPEAPLMEAPVPREGLTFPANGRHAWLAAAVTNPSCDGRAQSSETTFVGQMQQFENGWLLWNGQVAFVLLNGGAYLMF